MSKFIPRMEDNQKTTMGMIDSLPPRLAFWAGVVVTMALGFAIGFVMLVVFVVKGGDFSMAKSNVANKNTTAAAVANTNTSGTAAAKPAGKVDPASLRNVRGSGEYTVIEYSDHECPFCKTFHQTMQQVAEEYDGQVKWSYKQLPLPSLHSKAPRESNASECAADQGKFWEYADAIFERTNSNDSLPDEELFTIADDLGLDRAKFDDCLENEANAARISEDSSEAEALGAQGTPFSVIIDGDGNVVDTIPGALPYASVKQQLDALLK